MHKITLFLKSTSFVVATYLLTFSATFATTGTPGAFTATWITDVVEAFGSVVSSLIPIFIALAFLVFVWGLVGFILASGDEAAKDEGRRRMIWGVIALFVITAIWGILALLQQITGTKDGSTTYPKWPTTQTP
jgi:hypothetical protein